MEPADTPLEDGAVDAEKAAAGDMEALKAQLEEAQYQYQKALNGPTDAEKLQSQSKIDAYQKKMLETWEEMPPFFITSAEKGTGREEVLDYIEKINKSL